MVEAKTGEKKFRGLFKTIIRKLAFAAGNEQEKISRGAGGPKTVLGQQVRDEKGFGGWQGCH